MGYSFKYLMCFAIAAGAVACSNSDKGSKSASDDKNTYYLSYTLKSMADQNFKKMNSAELKLNSRSWLGSYKKKSVIAVQEKGKNYLSIYDIEYVETKKLEQGSVGEMYETGYNNITKVILLDLPPQDNDATNEDESAYVVQCDGVEISVVRDDEYERLKVASLRVKRENEFDYLGFAETTFVKTSKDHPFISEFKLAKSKNVIKVDCRSEKTKEADPTADDNGNAPIAPNLLEPTESSLEIQRQLVGQTVDLREDTLEADGNQVSLRAYLNFHDNNEVTVTQFVYDLKQSKGKKISLLSKIRTTYKIANAPSGDFVTILLDTKNIILDEVSSLGCNNNSYIKGSYMMSLKNGKIRKNGTDEKLRFLGEDNIEELNRMVKDAIEDKVCEAK